MSTINGFQFIHLETYGRKAIAASVKKVKSKEKKIDAKASMKDVANECMRTVSYCNHVTSPDYNPMIVYGISPLLLVDEITADMEKAKDKMGRKLRIDAQGMVGGIISLPPDINNSKQEISRWIKDQIKYLKETFDNEKSELASCVLHTDECNIHLHFYNRAKLGKDLSLHISQCHPGVAARDSVKGSSLKAKNNAYKDAMRALQNDYYEKVARGWGMTRLGPRKRRLSYSEWKLEKQHSQSLAKYEEDIVDMCKDVESRNQAVIFKEQQVEEKEKDLDVYSDKIVKANKVIGAKNEKYINLECEYHDLLIKPSTEENAISYFKRKIANLLTLKNKFEKTICRVQK